MSIRAGSGSGSVKSFKKMLGFRVQGGLSFKVYGLGFKV